jgi:hypothetical protein
MKVGKMVKIRAYGDKILTLKLIRQDKDTVIVCSAEEYNKAQSEGRAPICVGFQAKYIPEEQ